MSNNLYNHKNQHLIMKKKMTRSEKADLNTRRRERYQQKKLAAMIKIYNAHIRINDKRINDKRINDKHNDTDYTILS